VSKEDERGNWRQATEERRVAEYRREVVRSANSNIAVMPPETNENKLTGWTIESSGTKPY